MSLHTILIVDDDPHFRDELRDYLDEYRIIEASNGEEALNLLSRPNEIEMVVLDVMMPGLRGTEVLKRMKKMAPDLGIIILTGYSSKDIAIEALKGHADDYIEKPLQIHKLKQTIERFLESKGMDAEVFQSDMQWRAERAKRFLERNYNKELGLKEAAKAVCLSPKYLSRIFKQNVGMGFNEYKILMKIERAKELLPTGRYTVNEVAYKVGYRNPESFMRTFKRISGCTPSMFKEKAIVVEEKGEDAGQSAL
jgi:YesN/AraC family two-component response regulator